MLICIPSFQNESNGESSNIENHTKRETRETKNLSTLPVAFPKDDVFYDFTEERVRLLFFLLFLFFFRK